MKRIITWIWGFVPLPARAWVIGGLVLAAIAAVGFVIHKIDAAGYNRCEDAHKAAAATAKDAARPPIIETGKAHDKIKEAVAHEPGNNDPVGPRTNRALDSLQEQMDRI